MFNFSIRYRFSHSCHRTNDHLIADGKMPGYPRLSGKYGVVTDLGASRDTDLGYD